MSFTSKKESQFGPKKKGQVPPKYMPVSGANGPIIVPTAGGDTQCVLSRVLPQAMLAAGLGTALLKASAL